MMETENIFAQKRPAETVDTPERRSRILAVLASHVGKTRAVGMAALYEAAFDEPWANKINDTRALRTIITAMRNEGVPICSVASQNSGGYYLASAGSELAGYLRSSERRALKILKRNATIKKISLPDYLGQMRLHMQEAGDGEAA